MTSRSNLGVFGMIMLAACETMTRLLTVGQGSSWVIRELFYVYIVSAVALLLLRDYMYISRYILHHHISRYYISLWNGSTLSAIIQFLTFYIVILPKLNVLRFKCDVCVISIPYQRFIQKCRSEFFKIFCPVIYKFPITCNFDDYVSFTNYSECSVTSIKTHTKKGPNIH